MKSGIADNLRRHDEGIFVVGYGDARIVGSLRLRQKDIGVLVRSRYAFTIIPSDVLQDLSGKPHADRTAGLRAIGPIQHGRKMNCAIFARASSADEFQPFHGKSPLPPGNAPRKESVNPVSPEKTRIVLAEVKSPEMLQ